MSGQAKLARELYPFLVEMGMAVRGGGGGTSGGLVKHDLNGPYHNGVLAQSQAPWAATVSALNAHANNPNAHHARQHSIISASDHTIGGAAWDLVGKTAGGTLGLLSASADVSGGASAILRSNTGDLTVNVLTAAGSGGKVRTPTIDTASGNLAISPASGITTLSDLRASTRLRSPLIDTASGNLALEPASGIVTLEQLQASVAVWTPRMTSSGNLLVDPTGDITLDPGGNDVIVQDAAARALRSSNYTVGFPLAGFRIGTTTLAGQYGVRAGVGEFDELRARIFVADETRVDRGQEYITKSYGVLSRLFTSPASIGDTGYIYFENSPHIAGALFTANDWVLLRYLDMSGGIVLTSVWGQVASYYTTGLTGEQRWIFTLRQGTTGLDFLKGALAVNFGASGQSYILSDAISADAPFIQIGYWTTNPYTPANRTVTTQIGRLDGVGFTGEYGIAASDDGFTSADTWFKVSTGGADFNNITAEWYVSGVRTLLISPATGVSVTAPNATAGQVARAYTFYRSDGSTQLGGVFGWDNVGGNVQAISLEIAGSSATKSQYAYVEAKNTHANDKAFIEVQALGPSGRLGQVEVRDAVVNITAYDGTTLGALQVLPTAINATRRLRLVQGTEAAPSLIFSDAYADTGLFAFADQVSVSIEGQERFRLIGDETYAYGSLDVTSTVTAGAGSWGTGYRFSAGAYGILSNANYFIIESNGASIFSSRLDANDSILRVGYGNTNSRNSSVELYAYGSAPTDYDARLYRNLGQHGALWLINQGTGGIVINNAGAGPIAIATNNVTRATILSTGELLAENGFYVAGEAGGRSGYVGLTSATQGVSSGNGTIKVNGTTARNSTGWLKIYVGTAIKYLPYFDTVTG